MSADSRLLFAERSVHVREKKSKRDKVQREIDTPSDRLRKGQRDRHTHTYMPKKRWRQRQAAPGFHAHRISYKYTESMGDPLIPQIMR